MRRARMLLLVAILTLAGVIAPDPDRASAAEGDIGYLDQAYNGAVNPATADKPQSKLWYNDGSWWADMFDTVSRTWHIFKLNHSTNGWIDTGVKIDDRPGTHADTLWDGSHLYVASHVVTTSSDTTPKPSISGSPARLYRYSYSAATKTYTLDAGFPAQINNNSSESMTLDKDSTGKLWVTWTQVSQSSTTGYTSAVFVNATTGGDNSWGTPFVLPVAGANPAPDDISALVAFGRNRIGVMWSNQLDDTVYWAVHPDGAPTSTWTSGPAVRGKNIPDDHMNIKSIQADNAGRVFAAVKTSLDGSPTRVPTDPQINLLVFKPATGAWSTYLYGTLADCHTRPIVMLDDTQVYVFAAAPTASGCPFAGAAGTIYEKTASIDNPSFSSGRGTPVVRDIASENMNDPTSSKQSVNNSTGLVVLASNDSTKRYWHADLQLGGTTSTAPTASFTSSPTSGVAPLAVQFTDTSTGAPTAWAWDFGDGSTSTEQSPAHTFATAGTYTVSLSATNGTGSSAPVSSTITVTASPTSTGTVTAGTSTTGVSTTATTSVTLSKPANTTAGDVLVASFTADNLPAVSGAPAGWTSFVPALKPGSGATLFGYYHVVTSADDPTSNWTWSLSTAQKWNGGITRYLGVNPNTPLDTTVSTGINNSTATTVTAPAITTATPGAMVIGGLGADGSTPTTTPPSGWTESWESTGAQVAEQANRLQSTAGSTGPQTWTISDGRALAVWMTALRPN